MKLNIIKSCLLLVLGLAAASCEYDNFEEPKSTLTGRIVYEGEPIGLRSQGVELELWQHGYELFQKIPVYVAQDGTFSAKLFNGDYKLTFIRGNGPWMDRTDSIDVQVSGTQMLDVEVDPYYTISEPSYSVSGSTMTVNFTVNGVNTSSDLELAGIYMGRTLITDAVRNEGAVIIPAGDITLGTPMSVDVEIPAGLAGRSDVFVRVGVKTLGVQELLYSQVENVDL
ncbi:DUF3823 domain-containing protein [Echinicola jeungdonensis]|uniref:DUF3823 domain-containing protein n=1 Tax=Echinicola jeungdonensis TaxID=709343 RepID=A0ABV5J1J9_9BACT|nr:DUF3823 domain-containing protein [Echinicola jeungdonensis]MDN3668518.1 DUF3823 domain-containing protein [Echinicola jeungdonensis]